MSNKSQHTAVVIAVPARLSSSRLPGKVMADIGGKPMLRHVLERCALVRGVEAVVACSDSELVLDAVRSWGFGALATSEQCSSGSDRLASVVAELVRAGGCSAARTLVINVQGDQPCLDPGIVEQMIREAGRLGAGGEHSWVPVITPVYPLGAGKLQDPNVVKVLRAADGRAITFSRSAIPHVRDVPAEQWHEHTTYWGHVGIYGYRADVLEGWAALPHSALEGLEKLEQLRLVEAGIPIATFAVEADCFSVDSAAQLEQARAMLQDAG